MVLPNVEGYARHIREHRDEMEALSLDECFTEEISRP
jgi:hypothetical protein